MRDRRLVSALHVLVGLASIALTSCASAGPSADRPDEASDAPAREGTGVTQAPSGSAVTLYPTQIYVGLDETKAYAVPLEAGGGGGTFRWRSSDPAVVTVTVDATGGRAVVTAARSGTAVITVSSGDFAATALVTVNAYTARERLAGEDAYASFRCAACHESARGHDLTPSGISKHTDAELQQAFTAGTNPEGGLIPLGPQGHLFAVPAGDPAFRGLPAFLRSLPPRQEASRPDVAP
jgi:hypothetical protein